MEFTPGIVAVLGALTVFLGLYAIFAPSNKTLQDATGEEFIEGTRNPLEIDEKDASTVKYVRKMLNNFLPALGLKGLNSTTQNSLKSLMVKSGNPWKLYSPEELLGSMIVFAAVGFFTGLVVGLFNLIPISTYVLVFLTTLLAGAMPYSIYNTAKQSRSNEVQKQLPEALDLLVVTLASGLPFAPALSEVVPQMPPGLLKDMFKVMDEKLRAGDSLENALNAFANEVESDEVESFVKAIIQSQQLGSDITETLSNQAVFVRTNHEARVQKKIARLSTSMFIPLAGTMLPAFLIIFIAPSIVSIINQL
jgi:tight adherence protein C